MGFEPSERVIEIRARLEAFMDEHVFPREHEYEEFVTDQRSLWKVPPFVAELKAKAREQGLWNFFLPKEYEPWSPGLTNLEIAPLMETKSRDRAARSNNVGCSYSRRRTRWTKRALRALATTFRW